MDRWSQRYVWHLDQIPALLAAMRGAVVPLKSSRYDSDRVSGGGDSARLPFRVDAMDDADELWALLVLYAGEVVSLIGGSSPAVLRGWSWSTCEVAGVPAGVGAVDLLGASSEVVRWLCDRVEAIAALSGLEDSEDQLFGRVRSLRQAYRLASHTPRARRRRCLRCGSAGVVGAWETVAGREVGRLWCVVCGSEAEAPALVGAAS
jgi:hypothetical protein